MDQDLAGDKRVAAVTWVAIIEDNVLPGTKGKDAGEVILHLMQSEPSAVARDMISWIMMRHSRMERAVIALTTDPSMADRLKEDYLDFVANYAADLG